jgi:CubicO group peptidase (beta-lactamase class C family)
MTLTGVPRGGRLGFSVLVAALVGCAPPVHPTREHAVLTARSPAESSASSAPRFAVDGPNADKYGASEGYPVRAIFRTPFFVGMFSHYDQIFEGRTIRRAATPSTLRRVTAEPALRYEYQTETFTLDDYLSRNPTTGLLVARGDTILVERYQYARNDRHRFASFSMAKTVTAMLIGIAIAENLIRSVDDLAGAYVPALAYTEYGRTPLRHLLQMSSGVRFTENYGGRDDSARLVRDTYVQLGAGGVEAVKPYNDRVRPSGTRFSYASVETQVLGLVLRTVTGRPVAEYLQEKIWEPMGAEADATWLIDRSGQEATYCCLNAVLRDYARLGLLLAHDGGLGNRQIIPKAWVHAATTVPADAPHLRVAWRRINLGYGYQTWIFAGERRAFALIGVHGQAIYVDPSTRLVMVHTAVRERAADPNEETIALWRGVVDVLGP